MDNGTLLSAKDRICDEAMRRYPDFWREKIDLLNEVFGQVSKEMDEFYEIAGKSPVFSQQDVASFKGVWCISGSGSYDKPLIDTPSDNAFKDRLWYHNSDRIRLDYAAKIILNLAGRLSKSFPKPNEKEVEIIENYGPILIYNGIEEHNETLLRNAGKSFPIPISRIYIPEGEIERTIDQVRKFELPDKVLTGSGDKIGIVSHTTHLTRVIRLIGKYPAPFKNVELVLFPIRWPDEAGESESRELEMLGILDYIAKGEATAEPFPYSLIR